MLLMLPLSSSSRIFALDKVQLIAQIEKDIVYKLW